MPPRGGLQYDSPSNFSRLLRPRPCSMPRIDVCAEDPMYDFRKFFINGAWVSPAGRRDLDVINPATEQPIGKILLGTAEDVDAAVKAARAAFETYSQTSRDERIALLERIIKVYQSRMKDV